MRSYLYLLSIVLFTSCAQSITKGQQYSLLYEEKPVSIVVMPPINKTNAVEAKDYFYTTLYMPLCEKGYYVFSPNLTMALFQNESAYDSELFLEEDLGTFKSVLGADAAMFTIIKTWERNNLLGQLTVGVEYILRSTQSGETLYKKEGLITVDTSVNSGGASGLSLLVDMVATAVNTAVTDNVEAGRRCNTYVLSDLPVGKYNVLFGKDMEEEAGKLYLTGTVR